jgi:hypothetical protein
MMAGSQTVEAQIPQRSTASARQRVNSAATPSRASSHPAPTIVTISATTPDAHSAPIVPRR